MRLKPSYFIIHILFCLLLLADAMVFPHRSKTVTLTGVNAKLTYARRTRYYNYFIYTTDGCKYEVGEGIYSNLDKGDTVTISSSIIFHMPLQIAYRNDGSMHTYAMGQLSTKDSEKYVLIICIVISLIALIMYYVNPSALSQIFFVLPLLSFAMSLVAFLFVMIEVWSV
jgi:hypothetical protein